MIEHPLLFASLALAAIATPGPTTLLAGNVFVPYREALAGLPGQRQAAWPTATALLRLAPALLEQGFAVSAHEAMPLYVRDKVAKTTDERERLRLAQMASAAV